MSNFFHWLIDSDAGLAARIAAGAVIFALLAVWDIRRHGRAAQRWREYVYLLAAVAAAMVYGIVNDQITVSISWEYFYYGKELYKVLPAEPIPPEPAALRWHAAIIGMKATWTAGLLLGVAFLLANNPRKNRPRLAWRKMYTMMLVPLVAAVICSAWGGLAGGFGLLDRLGDWLVVGDRPRPMLAVWGIHFGGYLGGLIGGILGVVMILQTRKQLAQRRAEP